MATGTEQGNPAAQRPEVRIADVQAYLAEHESKDLLRLLTCGSVDDGKSTLIGHLLHDTGNIFIDQADALVRDSLRMGNAGEGAVDYSLLVDGLKAEREQGITIDVAYRYFTTPKRKFIIADCPGHEQYTRNMVTGGSTADVAIVLIDARHGVLQQTKRHSFITNLLGIRHVVVAINKMDLVDYSEERYQEIVSAYREFARALPNTSISYQFIPLSALVGDNISSASENMPWYEGPNLLEKLETVQVSADRNFDELFYPVQYVLRPNLDFRGFAGTLVSGRLRPGQRIKVLPSGTSSTVDKVIGFEEELDEAFPPMSVTVTLNDEIDISRGDVIVDEEASASVGAAFEAMLVWMDGQAMQPGRNYLIKHLCNTVPGVFADIDHRVDVNTLEHSEAKELQLNEIAKVRVHLNRSVVFDSYRDNKQAGAFIVIDRITNGTVGAGMILGPSAFETDATRRLGQGRNTGDPVSALDRAARHNQRPAIVWLAGNDASQRLCVARELEKLLFDDSYMPYVLDMASVSLDMRRIFDNDDGGNEDRDRREGQRWALALSRVTADAGLLALAVVGDSKRDEGDAALDVYVDGDPLRTEPRRPVEDDTVPHLRFEDGGADAVQTAKSIAEYLRREGLVGYFRDDDMIVF